MLSSTSNTVLSSSTNGSFCPAIFENLCWPQTTAGNHSVNISCALMQDRSIDPTKFINRYCNPSGKWTNPMYEKCFLTDVAILIQTSYSRRPTDEKKIFEKIVRDVRIGELVGLSISFTSVLVSLFVFFYFKSLYCSRTKIHINLLLAILIQIVARLTTYGIQMVKIKITSKNECDINGSLNPYLKLSVFDRICPLFFVFLQFGITAMFMWMLCEGIHLNIVLTVGVFKKYFKTYYFYILGWVVPFCLTLSWSIVMFIKEPNRRCFNNYMHLKYYWIIDGPRYAVMIINIIFLLNIIRVLVVKIREGSEKQIREDNRRSSMNAKFVKKAVKAAIFLLPLLGITHVLETFISADEQSITVFGIYCWVTTFLTTLQGFFCSLLYCFLNAEVRETLSRRMKTTRIWYRWKQYLGKKEQLNNEIMSPNNRTHLDLDSINSPLPKKSPIELEERRLTSDID